MKLYLTKSYWFFKVSHYTVKGTYQVSLQMAPQFRF